MVRTEIKKQAQPVLRQHIAQRSYITDAFSTKPVWQSRVNVTTTEVQMLVYLRNASQRVRGGVTMATLIMWLFFTGTRPHIIRAKPGKWLAFMWGGKGSYDRITKLSGGRGSGKVRGGQMTFREVVRHPGFAPSPALKKINDRLFKPLKEAIDRGIRLGLR
jgi:hypothetical protein